MWQDMQLNFGQRQLWTISDFQRKGICKLPFQYLETCFQYPLKNLDLLSYIDKELEAYNSKI